MLLGLLLLALVDSINPSAIVVTLYLLSGGRAPAHILVYVAASGVRSRNAGERSSLG